MISGTFGAALAMLVALLVCISGAVAVAVFSGHHEGYWLVAELPCLAAFLIGALIAMFLLTEELL